MGKDSSSFLEKTGAPCHWLQGVVKLWWLRNLPQSRVKRGIGKRDVGRAGRRKAWSGRDRSSDVGTQERGTGRALTFVFSRSSGLRAHGTAHKHPVAPAEGLVYQGYS